MDARQVNPMDAWQRDVERASSSWTASGAAERFFRHHLLSFVSAAGRDSRRQDG